MQFHYNASHALSFQVQSRVQKYFLKLQKAGLPVPGKMSKHSKIAKTSGGKIKSVGSVNSVEQQKD